MIQYKIAPGPDRKAHPTAKWKASAKTGLGGGTGLAIVLGYFIARLDPNMPQEVLLVFAMLLASWLTSGAMLLTGWLARPSPRDRPVVDEAASKRPVEPLPPQ